MRQHAAVRPFPSSEELSRIDEAVAHIAPPPPQVPVPDFGAPQRDAIASLVDNHVQDVCARIDGLMKQLNAMKQQVLVGSAATKQTLNQHIDVCLTINEETDRISDVVDQLAQKVLRL